MAATAHTLNAQLQGAMEHLGVGGGGGGGGGAAPGGGGFGPSMAYVQHVRAPTAAPPIMYAAPQPRFASASRVTDSVYGDPANNLQQLFTVQSGASALGPAAATRGGVGSKPVAPSSKPKKSYWWIAGLVILALVVIAVVVVVITRIQAKKQQAKDMQELHRIEAERAATLQAAEAAERAVEAERAAAERQRLADAQAARAAQAAQVSSTQAAQAAQAAAVARARAAAAAVASQPQPTLIITSHTQQPQPATILKHAAASTPRVEYVLDDEEPVVAAAPPAAAPAATFQQQDDTLESVNARIASGVEALSNGITAAAAAAAATV